MKRRLPWTAALALLVVYGCDAGSTARQADGVLSDDRFVQIVVELRQGAKNAEGGDAGERRKAILERHGVTEEDLLRYVEIRGTDVDAMVEVWSAIDKALNSDSAADRPSNDGPRSVAKADA